MTSNADNNLLPAEVAEKAHERMDRHVDNDKRRWTMLVWSVILLYVIGVILSTAFLVLLVNVRDNTKVIDRNERTHNLELEHTSFRLCQRESVDRAFVHAVIRKSELKYVQKVLPILDCYPNLHGGPAKVMTRDQQKQFVNQAKSGTLSRDDTGICPSPPVKAIC